MSVKTKTFVNVVFPKLSLKELTYKIPPELDSIIEIGHRVLVSVGSRKESGFAISFPESTSIKNLKYIEDIVESKPLITEDLLRLCLWTADYYMASIGEAIRAMLPSALQRETRLLIRKNPNFKGQDTHLTSKQQKILNAFNDRDTLIFENLQKRLNIKTLRYEISRLEKINACQIHYILEEAKKPKVEKWISLNQNPTQDDWKILHKYRPRQAKTLEQIIEEGSEVPRTSLEVNFSVLKKLEADHWITITEQEVERDSYSHISLNKPRKFQLTEHQLSTVNRIIDGCHTHQFIPFLLHGVTASGKTQVYLEIIRSVLDMQKTALILIPEISLTPQAVQRYRSVFGNLVAVLHSRMSDGERLDSWKSLYEGRCRIALGPRSAIFAPLENLGIIIVDEEHDQSYKQNDPAPRYNARDLAVMRAKINKCVVVLGSATPSLETYANTVQKKYELCSLPERIDRVPLPKIDLVDRNLVPPEFKRRILSPLLHQKIQACYSHKDQAILLQNRRGYATYLRCQSCGHIESCDNCDITLTYHQTDRTLRCHLCGFQKSAPSICKKCQGPNLKYRGAGTQKVEEEIATVFPEIKLLRMDFDTTRSKHAHSQIVTAFEKHQADILLGTQMVSKGHDFPGVNLVGIISADTGLLFPDFRAEERTFQMLIQAAGRAGRRNVQGEVVIQTFYPDHPIFNFIINQDYYGFFNYTMEHRKSLNYPPFGRLIAIRFRSGNEKQCEHASKAFLKSIRTIEQVEVLGPVASPISKKMGQYRFQIVLRISRLLDPSGRKLRTLVRNALDRYTKEYHFPEVHLTVDVDPMDLL